MQMMGSSGPVSLSAMLADLIEALKSADQTLPAAVVECRSAQAEANSKIEELNRVHAELDAFRGELHAREGALDAREVDLAKAEAEASAKQGANLDRAAQLDAVAGALDEKQKMLDEHLAGIASVQRAARQEIAQQKSVASAEIDAATAQLDRDRRECAAVITAAHDEAHRETIKMRAEAATECAALRAGAQRLMDAAVAKEAAVRKHAAELAALSAA